MQTVLAVDDELSVRQAYRFILGKEYSVLSAESAEAALGILDEQHVDLILLDMVMPGMHGLSFLEELRRREEIVPVIMVTASNSVVSAAEALRQGAVEYLSKPFDVQQLSTMVARALRESQARRELLSLRRACSQGFDAIAGHSRALLDVLARAQAAAQSEEPVLITGEMGTGKGLLARAIHGGSARSGEAFVELTCGGPCREVERELLGRAGSESGVVAGKLWLADRGTLFLDEVGRLSAHGQGQILRALEEGLFHPLDSSKAVRVSIRLIGASRCDLGALAQGGSFRAELLERMGAIRVEVPPLRERRDDVPPLAAFFLARHGARIGARAREFSSAALDLLASRAWPGNVRELENVVELALMYHGDAEVIEPGHLEDVLPGKGAGVGVRG